MSENSADPGARFHEMAKKREFEAKRISDEEIWRNVVKKVLLLNIEPDMKVTILMQSISDLAIILQQLKYFNSSGVLENKEYKQILEYCIEQIEAKREPVDYNPLNYHD